MIVVDSVCHRNLTGAHKHYNEAAKNTSSLSEFKKTNNNVYN